MKAETGFQLKIAFIEKKYKSDVMSRVQITKRLMTSS
jgi:hypothetical protein